MTPSRRLGPDIALETALIATVDRDLREARPRDESIERLRQDAAGRNDVLAKAAGYYLGRFLALPLFTPGSIECASRLAAAGASPEQVVAETDQVRTATKRGHYTTQPAE